MMVKKLLIHNCEMCPYFEILYKYKRMECFNENYSHEKSQLIFKNKEDYESKHKQLFENCPLYDDNNEEIIKCRRRRVKAELENWKLKNALNRLENKINEVYKWVND